MENGFALLVEKEEMWAQLLLQVLQDHDIPCVSIPVYGAGLVVRTGMQERLRVYVPEEKMQQAADLLQQLFSEDMQQEDAE